MRALFSLLPLALLACSAAESVTTSITPDCIIAADCMSDHERSHPFDTCTISSCIEGACSAEVGADGRICNNCPGEVGSCAAGQCVYPDGGVLPDRPCSMQ